MNIFLFHGEFDNELPELIFNHAPDCHWTPLTAPLYPHEEGTIKYSSEKLDLSPDLASNLKRYKNRPCVQDLCARLVVNQLPEISNLVLTECLTLDQVEIIRTAAKRLGHNLIVFTD